MGDAGAASLATALPFSSLELLSLAANPVGAAGAASLARAARAAPPLRLLDLRGAARPMPATAREAAAACLTCRVLFDDDVPPDGRAAP